MVQAYRAVPGPCPSILIGSPVIFHVIGSKDATNLYRHRAIFIYTNSILFYSHDVLTAIVVVCPSCIHRETVWSKSRCEGAWNHLPRPRWSTVKVKLKK